MTQEALKLALEALETELSIDWTNNDEFNASAEKMYEAIKVIKEALTQPEQKPVAVYGYCPECGAKGVMRERRPNGNDKCANGHTYPSSKSTPPQPEPVAWMTQARNFIHLSESTTEAEAKLYGWKAVYTHLQRKWVGLEGEEIRNLWEEATKPDRSTMTMITSFARAIEAKLKEKNT